MECEVSRGTSAEGIFQCRKVLYALALRKWGVLSACLVYLPFARTTRDVRSKNVIWFFAPFGLQLGTKFGRIFWRHLNAQFPGNSPLAGVFSGGTVGLGYSCTRDMLQCKAVRVEEWR